MKKIEGFTKNKFKRAQDASLIYHQLGAPTMENTKMIIFQNLINNYPVTTEDINLSHKKFGPGILMLKGRSTRPKPV